MITAENSKHCILPLLLVAGCMCPLLAVCWDDSIIPKWYATAMAAVFCGIVCQKKDIRKKRISEWLSGMAIAASAGILFQAGYILLDRGKHDKRLQNVPDMQTATTCNC